VWLWKLVSKLVTKVAPWPAKVTTLSGKLAVGVLNWLPLANSGKKSNSSSRLWIPSNTALQKVVSSYWWKIMLEDLPKIGKQSLEFQH
jgi:hypothetical protein